VDAWQASHTADRLLGPGPSVEPYALEGHAGIPEVCLTLLELDGAPGPALRQANAGASGPGPAPAELRATAAAGVRRLRRYARAVPMARPRALVCLGWSRWLDARPAAARRAWAKAVREAERLRMPYELARAHHELGRHLAAGKRSPLGLDRAGHLERALAGFQAIGCGGELRLFGR
jgi:hypothetical protein